MESSDSKYDDWILISNALARPTPNVSGCGTATESSMSIRLVHPLSDQLDIDDTCIDGIWRVRTRGVPDRYTRIYIKFGMSFQVFDAQLQM